MNFTMAIKIMIKWIVEARHWTFQFNELKRFFHIYVYLGLIVILDSTLNISFSPAAM